MLSYTSYITRRDATGKMEPPDGKRKIFISYKHSDEATLPLCQRLASYILERLDVAIWFDKQLTAGKEYDKEIEDAIKQSDAFLLLLTPGILSSAYVIEREVPLAIQSQVAVLPVIAGISEAELPLVEKVVGRVHMPLWFFGAQKEAPAFSDDALKQLLDGLALCLANKDLLSQATLFCERGSHTLSQRYLTPEQVFVKAYGCLFGVAGLNDKALGIKLMDSILASYGTDEEFVALQEEVAVELLKHLYRTNQPLLFFPYLQTALARGFEGVMPLLFDIYKAQWEAERLQSELAASLALFRYLYKENLGIEFDSKAVLSRLDEAEVTPLATTLAPQEGAARIGSLVFEGHVAFLERSCTEKRDANLFLDGYCLDTYEVYAAWGDSTMIFLAYDPDNRLLLTLHADFDHYEIESYISGKAYQLTENGIKSVQFRTAKWVKGRRFLPYNPMNLKVPEDA